MILCYTLGIEDDVCFADLCNMTHLQLLQRFL